MKNNNLSLKKYYFHFFKEIDKAFIITIIILCILGAIFIADVSSPIAQQQFSDKYYFLNKHANALAIGFFSMYVFYRLNLKYLKKYASFLFFSSVFLLILVLLPSFGSKLLGARRWLVIGPINFQPSELVKLTIAIYIAKVASSQKKLFAYLFPLIIVTFLILLQPDFGTNFLIAGIVFSQIMVSEVSLIKYLFLLFMGFAVSLGAIFTSEYRRQRLMGFLNISEGIENSYHLKQILVALGSGGILGVGIGQSRQKFLFLPESISDSVFAVIVEETGFIGGSIIIFLFLYLFIKGIRISYHCDDVFYRVLSTGIVVWITMQAFINIASQTVIIPLTGIPLPFFSYGGTSIVSVLTGAGIILNIASNSSARLNNSGFFPEGSKSSWFSRRKLK